MATRNLARAAVEGGRRGRYMQHYETRVERRAVKAHLQRIQNVDDALDAGTLHGREDDWDSGFTDKLNPTERFLASNAGRPWDDVYSELCRRFDRRSLKGWHLLRHVDRMVHGHRERWPRAWFVYGARVDELGVLRYVHRNKWRV